jgi:hypothetical protein
MKNTYTRAAVRCIVFREKGTWYGVALEFNVVVDGDSPQVVFDELDKAVKSYFSTAKKHKLDVSVLNQVSDVEYLKMWNALDTATHSKKGETAIPQNLYSSLILRPAMA